ncbi:YihA family ribosome biogenesis GTP-binding protein [bacterium]|nr:YihA family ribosome biogenesis GTP-binding protein [bacterium]
MVDSSLMQSEYVMSAVSLDELPKNDKPHIAMVGRSNVGKSSLINSLTQRKDLAHVSTDPGRTQTMNLYALDRKFYLMDLPGYGFARKSKDQREVFAEMIETYLLETPQLKLVLLIIDARTGPTEFDQNMLAFLQLHRLPFVMVVNKMDKLKKNAATALLRDIATHFSDLPIIPHSNVAQGNRAKILQVIDEAIRS